MKIIIFFTSIFLNFSLACSTANEPTTTIARAINPTEIYGPAEAKIALTLGNGGAGPTCILQALSEDFIISQNLNIRIAWIQNISRLTLLNLKEGVIDIALTYESEPELQAVKEGWASERSLAFNDHFILIGPKNNPSGILSTDTAEEAFKKIALNGKFFSRDDLSGSNQRERMIWDSIGIRPWEYNNDWYVTQKVFPGDALLRADRENLYTLSDRGTLLATNNVHDFKNLTVFVQDSKVMMNPCHAMLQANPSPIAKKFLEYLISERAQALITHYAGKDKDCTTCCPLYTPASEDRFLDAECLQKIGLQ